MRRDVKTGMMIGLVLVIIAFIIFSITNPFSLERESKQTNFEQVTPPVHKENSIIEKKGTEITPTKPLPAEPVRKSAPMFIQYTVQQGETLSSIAETYLHDSNRWDEIMKLNEKIISSPDKLKPGMVITIPLIDQNTKKN